MPESRRERAARRAAEKVRPASARKPGTPAGKDGGAIVRPVAPKDGKVPVIFDSTSGSYLANNAQGEWMRYGDRMLSCLLREAGFSDLQKHETGLTYLEREMLRITRENSVHFAGPLGGFQPGIYEMAGSRILVTRGPKLLVPTPGKWPLFETFLTQLLGDQAKYFCAWIKLSLRALGKGRPWDPGQMLAIAGPGGSGKSLLQSLITPMLGGRVSSPYKYMAGGTQFNDGVIGAEHGLIGDQNHKTDKAARRNFGSAIKDLVANPEQMLRGLWKGGTTVMPFMRLSLTLNDNPNALLVMPEFDEDVDDKIILLHASRAKLPIGTKRFPDKQSFDDALRAELPHFLYHLRRWKIPASIQEPRYGVVSFKDEELIKKMHSVSSEQRLWSFIQMYVFADRGKQAWEGTAAELERLLRDQVKGENLNVLFNYPGACGQYLTALSKLMKSRIEVCDGPDEVNYYVIRRN